MSKLPLYVLLAGMAGAANASARDLRLEVFINGTPTKLIGVFHETPQQGLAASGSELHDLGLRAHDSPEVLLNGLPGVSWRVEEATQRLYITASDAARLPRVTDLRGSDMAIVPRGQADSTGAVLNYALTGTSGDLAFDRFSLRGGLSGSFDGRVYSPYGNFDQSFLATTSGLVGTRREYVKRVNTTYSYFNAERLETYRAGDVIAGGVDWSRPIQIGGLQLQRNFALRPDLITAPLPSYAGTAAVPSSVDVYVQNSRVYSGDVPAGPFQLNNIAGTGASEARVVLRDATGRETTTTLPLFASSAMLREGYYDYSADIGYARRFALDREDYDRHPVGTFSGRYGLPAATLIGHAEAGAGLTNAGAGAAFLLGLYGAMTIGAAASRFDDRWGSLINANVQTGTSKFMISMRTQWTLGSYKDLAAITAKPIALFNDASFKLFTEVPKAINQFSVSTTLPGDVGLSLGYTDIRRTWKNVSNIASVSLNRRIGDASVFATSFYDFGSRQGAGFFTGLSISFSDGLSVSVGAERTPYGTNAVASVSKSDTGRVDDYGWRVATSEGRVPYRTAGGTYRTPYARIGASVQQYGHDTRGQGTLDGSLVVAGGEVFAANRIDDAFAIIDVGEPGVDVQYENRPVGKTGNGGRMLVLGLRSNQTNQLSIDPSSLPVDKDVASTKQVVVPATRSGVIVRYGATEPASALVTFVDAKGTPLPKGMIVKHAGESFAIGYDGMAYVQRLAAQNTVTVEKPDGAQCTARFDYNPVAGRQTRIGSVKCE